MGAMSKRALKTRRVRAELAALVVGFSIVAGVGVATSGDSDGEASQQAGVPAPELVSK